MTEYRIRVLEKEGIFDAIGQGILKDIRDLGIKEVRDARFALLYYISGDISKAQIRRIAEELLIDRITQEYAIESTNHGPQAAGYRVVEVAYNPGVMDPVEEAVLKAIADMGISGVSSVRTAKQYLLKGKISEGALKTISEKLLYNKVIQHIVIQETSNQPALAKRSGPGKPETRKTDYQFKLITVDLLKAPDKKLQQISRDGQLFLNLAEMRQIRNYFKKLGRNPTDCELESIAQTWSE